MRILHLILTPFGFFFGADGFWKKMLFPKQTELVTREQRLNQFLYVLRPVPAAIWFLGVWQLITRGPDAIANVFADFGLAQTLLGTAARCIQWFCGQIYLISCIFDAWICEVFKSIHFFFPYNPTFSLSAIGVYILCYRRISKWLDKWLVDVGQVWLDASPAFKKGLEEIYTSNPATGKVSLSSKWGRVRQGLSRMISADLILFYALNCLTNFATVPLRDFMPINLFAFAGLFCLMEVYHYLGLGDAPQNKSKKSAQLNLAMLLTDYQRYAEKQGVAMTHKYQNSHEVDTLQQELVSYEGADDPQIVLLYQYLQERNQLEYMDMAVQLLTGNNVFYASPFYRDMDGCIFFSLFLSLLRKEKGLILTEGEESFDELADWLNNGLGALSGLGQLWTIAELREGGENADVGILPFQSCPDLLMDNGLEDFLKEVSFVVILESSNMLIGGQEFILTLAERISAGTTGCTWLLCDWNAESMLDLFSHLLKIDLTYVGPTPAGAKEVAVSFWDTETEPDCICPPIKRFLGLEIGIAETAEKKQVPCVNWCGADCMPVTDINWIIMQYYQLHNLPATRYVGQDGIQTHLQCCIPEITCRTAPEKFLIVEDSCYNLYEAARQYVTRGRDKVYVHILSPNYLLRDFMKSCSAVMEADPKYLSQLVPEYVNSPRNAYLHLLRRLLVEEVPEKDIYTQLNLCEEPPDFAMHPISEFYVKDAIKVIVETLLGISINVDSDIQTRKHMVFSEEEARMVQEPWCRITGREIHRAFLKYFRQARYVDETGTAKTISHLMLAGHLELKYLPGQFVTLRGKYYQVERILDSGNEMLLFLTRASDHLLGRYHYRQLRTYQINGTAAEEKTIFSKNRISLTRLSLNFTAETIGYITMEKGWNTCEVAEGYAYQSTARRYFGKQALRIDLPAGEVGNDGVFYFAAIVHDMFYTLFPRYCYLLSVAIPWKAGEEERNQQYRGVLSSLTIPQSGKAEERKTEAETPDKSVRSFYIFEDSCEDMGLLRSIERHFPRILQIAAEYVKWADQQPKSYFSS